MKISKDVIEKLSEQVSTIFGIGYTAYAPGTMGSLFGVLIYMFLKSTPIFVYLLVVILLFVSGSMASDIVENIYGIKDPSFVVIDEVVGMLITMMAVPYSFSSVVVGFLLFRVIDISKLPPLNILEKINGGLGIMIDDAVGGLIVNIILQVFFR